MNEKYLFQNLRNITDVINAINHWLRSSAYDTYTSVLIVLLLDSLTISLIDKIYSFDKLNRIDSYPGPFVLSFKARKSFILKSLNVCLISNYIMF